MRILDRALPICLLTLVAAIASGCSEASRLRGKCLGGDVGRCIELGDMYATGTRVPRDLTRAAEMYQQACDRGSADTCNTLGEIYEKGSELDGGLQRAEQLFKQACDTGSPAGCLNLGMVMAARDDKKGAAALFERSCASGWTAACHHLAAANEHGAGVLVDLGRAITLYENACAEKYVDSCVALAGLFAAGEKVERDTARAVRYYAAGMQIYAEGCDAGRERECKERDRLRTRMVMLAGQ